MFKPIATSNRQYPILKITCAYLFLIALGATIVVILETILLPNAHMVLYQRDAIIVNPLNILLLIVLFEHPKNHLFETEIMVISGSVMDIVPE